jgi:hypothetical protein
MPIHCPILDRNLRFQILTAGRQVSSGRIARMAGKGEP